MTTYFLDLFSPNGELTGQIYATDEQTTIISAARDTRDNLMISALAGAAKTTTLRFICKYVPLQAILSVAFTNPIVNELSRVLPGHVTCRTMNSIGHRVWAAATGRRLVLDFRKSYNLLKTQIESLSKPDRADAYDSMPFLLSALTAAKRQGYIPKGKFTHAKPIQTKAEFHQSLDQAPTSLEASIIEAALCDSITQAYGGTIDFDDQLYMPTLFGGSFPRFPLIMVDEFQDLSEINHAMLRKLVTSRIIGVGDPWQSIYAFRGAKQSGMDIACKHYSCTVLPLSVSFRCPEEIVKVARDRVPHMKWSRPGGKVRTLSTLSPSDIPDGAAIICRNNAPLYRLALAVLAAGRGIHLVGSDLGPALVKTIRKLGPETLTQAQTHAAIDLWEIEKLRKSRNAAAVSDKAECFRVFAQFGATLGGAIAYAEHLFSRADGAIQLLSGHKAKGLEWDVVYHLDPWRIPSQWARSDEEIEQELNVRYVINTRAKQELYFIDAKNILEPV